MITGMSAESTSRPTSEPTAPESGHAPRSSGAAPAGDEVLEPTAVFPGPIRAESQAPGEPAARVITGKVLAGGRHRGSRHRNSARVVGTAGTAVLSATGAFAGLTLLATHAAERADRHTAAAGAPRQSAAPAPRSGAARPAPPARPAAPPASNVPSGAQTATVEVAATAPATDAIGTATATQADDLTPAHTTPSRARHARPTGPWQTSDWEEALRRMLPNGRSFPGPAGFGRHHFR
jgi:hypothetical protein